MPFLLLLIVTVACLPAEWPEPPDWLGEGGSALLTWAGVGATTGEALKAKGAAGGSALLTWAGVGAVIGMAGLLARYFRRRLVRHPDQRAALLRRYASWRLYHLFTLLTVYLVSLYAWGWVSTARSATLLGVKNIPGVELLILAPFLAALFLSWAVFYNVERAIRETGPARDIGTFPGRWTYVGFQARHNLILVCPPLLMMVLQQSILWLCPELDQSWVLPLLSVGLLVGVFLTIPWILRLLLGWQTLPPGPLRDRLLAAARRLNFHCSDLLLWNTRRGMANAMVTGVLPSLRYVVVTDRLASELTPEEIEAVFGHEVGHIKHHHMLYYVVFLLVSMVVVAGVYAVARNTLEDWLPGFITGLQPTDVVAVVPFLGVLAIYIFVVFGFLSRRCERQADIYGCRAVSCSQFACPGHENGTVVAPEGRGLCATGIRTFIEALEKVARLNGISRDKPGWLSSWQHSTIARRVEFLQQVCADPEVEPRFQRRVRLVKWSLLLGLGALLAVVLVGLGLAGVLNSLNNPHA
jgi:Zn-dependent protease with chaperone function